MGLRMYLTTTNVSVGKFDESKVESGRRQSLVP
jgi:hypothetical protein